MMSCLVEANKRKKKIDYYIDNPWILTSLHSDWLVTIKLSARILRLETLNEINGEKMLLL